MGAQRGGTNLMFYLYNPSVTPWPLWFDGEFGTVCNLYRTRRHVLILKAFEEVRI